jgi:SWI/SNF-related matrix-associated actin-dependent regulator 1 of chromatin subfamily A
MDLSLRLMPFQQEGVDLLARSRVQMLAWEPGVGKTPTAVRACVKVKAERVLVLCPLIATSVWARHFKDWSGCFPTVRVLDSDWAAKPITFVAGEGVRIVPYSRAVFKSMAAKRVAEAQWDVVIIDEGHYLKNWEAQRTRVIYGNDLDLRGSALEGATYIWCLTGTPLLNGPHEFWTHLHALYPEAITYSGKRLPYDLFRERYCITKQTTYGIAVLGVQNAMELRTRIRHFIDRKRASDVIKDLPPLRITRYPLPEDLVIVTDELREALAEVEADTAGLDDDTLLATMQAGGVQFSTLRRLVGTAKIPGVAALVKDTLDAGPGSVIVFAHHRDVILALEKELNAYNPLVIMGGTSKGDREQAIEAFQARSNRLIILSITSASEAITLTAASTVIVAEPSPVPAQNAQAIARAHRKGQPHPVLARFVLLPGSFDARFMEIIARKTRAIMQVIDADLVQPTRSF